MNYNDIEGHYLQSDREPKRYNQVRQSYTNSYAYFSALYVHFDTFSNITLVFVVITFWFTADI